MPCAISRAVRAGDSTFSTRQRCGAGTPAHFSPSRARISSATPASCACVTARRSDATTTHGRKLALVGKGICFDTGGINLKTHKSMHDMHTDMQGSAVAVGTLLALTELRAPYDIDCWLAITENEIGARAFRPQEVVSAANGVTIQVIHTDAEGRMVLADTLALARARTPGTDRRLRDAHRRVRQRAHRAQQRRIHQSPAVARSDPRGRRPQRRARVALSDGRGLRQRPRSTVADILQCTLDSKGDHILAARFLSRFVPAQVPWMHIDLAASNRSGGLGHVPTDITGFGVRYTVELLGNGGLLEA